MPQFSTHLDHGPMSEADLDRLAQLLDAEAAAQTLHLRQERCAVGDVALVYGDGHRAAARISEQTVVDL